ncbi:MAG: hypothetical protein ACXABY_24715 [Candidatus Thorarchaeota archaeon]|jgi:hypothetical protein
MHTWRGRQATIHYNSDFSGELKIVTDDGELSVQASDILHFVVVHIMIRLNGLRFYAGGHMLPWVFDNADFVWDR